MRSTLLVLLALFASTLANAQTVHVPTDYPTIQEALDAGAAEIYVAQGTYPEVLVVRNDVQLLPEPPYPPAGNIPFPAVAGLLTEGRHQPTVYVRGFHFLGRVNRNNGHLCGSWTTFEACRLDSGFTQSGCPTAANVSLRGCLIFGPVDVRGGVVEVTASTIIGGGIDLVLDAAGIVRDNVIIGPAPVGIRSDYAATIITGNTIQDVGDGIDGQRLTAKSNVVRRCSGTGIQVASGTLSQNIVEDCGGDGYGFPATPVFTPGVTATYNIARRCGGHGFNFDIDKGGVSLRGNQVDSVGLCGIHTGLGTAAILVDSNEVRFSGSRGVWLESYGAPRRNLVLNAGGDGILCHDRADSNVVGRSAGRGIVAVTARQNTSYLNGSNGYELDGAHGAIADSVNHNVSYGNAGYGLVWTGSEVPVLECNDWFGNISGAVTGATPGSSDLAVDPLFCDLTTDDVTLAGSSLLMNQPACDQIGARGQGCSDPLSASASPIGREARLSVFPIPAGGTMAFRWAPNASPGRLEVFDVHGARRFGQDVPAGASSFLWNGKDANSVPIAPGVYFARLSRGVETLGTRVVLSR